MDTAKLTVRLQKKDLEFAKRYSQEHRITVAELINRYLQRLQERHSGAIHPDVERISGLVPSEIDAKALHLDIWLVADRGVRGLRPHPRSLS
jgi:hypothetical protein